MRSDTDVNQEGCGWILSHSNSYCQQAHSYVFLKETEQISSGELSLSLNCIFMALGQSKSFL